MIRSSRCCTDAGSCVSWRFVSSRATAIRRAMGTTLRAPRPVVAGRAEGTGGTTGGSCDGRKCDGRKWNGRKRDGRELAVRRWQWLLHARGGRGSGRILRGPRRSHRGVRNGRRRSDVSRKFRASSASTRARGSSVTSNARCKKTAPRSSPPTTTASTARVGPSRPKCWSGSPSARRSSRNVRRTLVTTSARSFRL